MTALPDHPTDGKARPAGGPGWGKRLQTMLLLDVQNPVIRKEMRGAMRGIRPTVLLTIYLSLMSGFVGLIYIAFASSNDVTTTTNISQTIGKAVFFTVVGLEMLMVCFLAPALSAGAISAERERQTYDLLRTTLLPTRSLVIGKLNAAILFLFVLLVVGFPLQAMAYFFGGVSMEEVLISFLMLGISTVIFCVIGLIISSLLKTTLAATVVSYIVTIMLLFGAPSFLLLLVFLTSTVPNGGANLSQTQELIFQIVAFSVGYVLVSINPLSAAIASELMISQQQKLFYTTLDMSYGWKFPVIAPWITYTIFAIAVSLLLIRLAIVLIHRVEK